MDTKPKLILGAMVIMAAVMLFAGAREGFVPLIRPLASLLVGIVIGVTLSVYLEK